MRKLTTKTNVSPISSDYPYGRAKDDSGSADGTPVNENLLGDMIQFFEKLMADGGVTANGLPDNAYSGFQLNQALNAIITAATPTATPSIRGLAKLYSDLLASNTDGSVTQAGIVAAFAQEIKNYSYTTTAGGSTQTAATIPRTTNKTTRYRVEMVARRVSGADPAGSSSSQQKLAKVIDIAGTGTLGAVTTVDSETDTANAPLLSIAVSGTNLLLQVSVGTAHVYDCKFRVIAMEV